MQAQSRQPRDPGKDNVSGNQDGVSIQSALHIRGRRTAKQTGLAPINSH